MGGRYEDRESAAVTGIVLSSMPIGEYDRRISLLTLERGKLSAFARGARKPGSSFMAGTRPFTFGEFVLSEGRSSYSVRQIRVTNYFEEVTADIGYVCLGSYFLELAEYYTRENADETPVLKLLYQALRALSNNSLDNRLVRMVYVLKIMMINGDIEQRLFSGLSAAAEYTVDFILNTDPGKLFVFALSEEVLNELIAVVRRNKEMFIDRQLRSEAVLDEMSEIC